jgi:hypothetical protein
VFGVRFGMYELNSGTGKVLATGAILWPGSQKKGTPKLISVILLGPRLN